MKVIQQEGGVKIATLYPEPIRDINAATNFVELTKNKFSFEINRQQETEFLSYLESKFTKKGEDIWVYREFGEDLKLKRIVDGNKLIFKPQNPSSIVPPFKFLPSPSSGRAAHLNLIKETTEVKLSSKIEKPERFDRFSAMTEVRGDGYCGFYSIVAWSMKRDFELGKISAAELSRKISDPSFIKSEAESIIDSIKKSYIEAHLSTRESRETQKLFLNNDLDSLLGIKSWGDINANEVLLYKQGKVSELRNIMSSNMPGARKSDIDEAMNMFDIKYQSLQNVAVLENLKREIKTTSNPSAEQMWEWKKMISYKSGSAMDSSTLLAISSYKNVNIEVYPVKLQHGKDSISFKQPSSDAKTIYLMHTGNHYRLLHPKK